MKQQVIDFLHGYATEVTPTQAARLDDMGGLLPTGTSVNVTFLPGAAFADTVATAKLVKKAGLRPVPHFAARSFASKAQLVEGLDQLQSEVGVDEVLVIAGGLDHPLGPFDNSMQLLETGLFEHYEIRRIGVAGHPEGSPDMSTDAIIEALQWKNAYARANGLEMYVTTQFCFDPAAIIDWAANLKALGNKLPIHIGIPGPANLKTLINYARLCGIGPSLRVLTRQARNITRLMTVVGPGDIGRGVGPPYRGATRLRHRQGSCLSPRRRETHGRLAREIEAGQFTVQPDGLNFILDNPSK